MTEQTYNLEFDGYWRDADRIPAEPGIYGVYTYIVNSDRTFTLKRLIYIGESVDMKDRVENHEKRKDWKKELREGEKIRFNAALTNSKEERKRAEAAMIHKHKPVCNTDYVDEFPFDTTTINTSGKNRLMKSHFTVYRT